MHRQALKNGQAPPQKVGTERDADGDLKQLEREQINAPRELSLLVTEGIKRHRETCAYLRD